jgi:hypothetical protein
VFLLICTKGRLSYKPDRVVQSAEAPQPAETKLPQARSFDPNLAKVSEWIIREGFQADIPALRAIILT